MLRFVTSIGFVALLGGCGQTQFASDEAVAIKYDTWFSSRAVADRQASEECAKFGKRATAVNVTANNMQESVVTYRCEL